MKRAEIKAIYDQGPDAVIDLVERLISAQQQQITKLTARVKELEDRLAKNSQNSSKPPSSDQSRKTKSLRKASGKKSGGQPGHSGNTLRRAENPDQTIIHQLKEACPCGFNLAGAEVSQYDCRQVFDLPPIKLEVTEHQVEVKHCPQCGKTTSADFPEGVTNVVQYGAVIKALIVYLMNYQLIPYRRTSEMLSDLLGQNIGEGTLKPTLSECATKLTPSNEQIKTAIKQAAVGNFDETGFYVTGKRFWLHVASTPTLTYYYYHCKRGSEALNEIDILPKFTGTAVHDGYSSYIDYQCNHSLCNAHHLRELTFLSERYGLPWAEKMIAHLLKIKETVDEARALNQTSLDKTTLAKFANRYQRILREGFAIHNGPRRSQPRRRGRKQQSPAKNLLDRLSNYRQATLAFMYDFNVPFDNNLAERDIRMMKVQQKISGTFRTLQGATAFCTIRSFISSIRKQGHNVFTALKSVFTPNPIQPALLA